VNLVRTITAALIGRVETENSWEVCRQRAVDLSIKAKGMLSADSAARVFVQKVQTMASKITASPSREFSVQRYASVMGDSIRTIEYEAVERSGVTIADLNGLVASLPGHQWLLASNDDLNEIIRRLKQNVILRSARDGSGPLDR
jgi:hypothetical protein